MSGPIISNPPKSPLTWFREGMAHGGIATSPTNTGGRPFPPRLAYGTDFRPIDAAPLARTGIVYSMTRIEARSGAFTLALIDLDGGGRLLARLRTDAEPGSPIGKRAELVMERREGEPFLTFEPISAEEAV
jgi:uncharacterized OB-fold protein